MLVFLWLVVLSNIMKKHKNDVEKNSDRRIQRSDKSINKKQTKKKDTLTVRIPKTYKDCDTNWKVLLSQLKQDKTVKEIKNKPKKKLKQHNSNGESDIWFDDVELDDILSVEQDSVAGSSEASSSMGNRTDNALVKANAFAGLTKAIGMDCEMVGTGSKGSQSIVARVSLVNQFGKCIYDKHVKPIENVTDYRTFVSGIRPSDLKGAEDFTTVQREVANILNGRILVGHALWNDLKVLYLDHPKKMIRDTASYKPFREYNNGRTPALRHLCKNILGVKVQDGEHSSVQDAQAAIRLYTLHKKQWEKELKESKNKKSS